MSKIYAGARLRRLREDRAMSQVDVARLLAISPSYLNQIEHDARPLTVTVLLRLSEVFGVDVAFFAPRDTARQYAELREALQGEAAGRLADSDVHELATRHPDLADAVIGLHRRYRTLAERAELIGDGRTGVIEQDAHQQVRDFFSRRENHFDVLDRAAEQTAAEVGDEPAQRLAGLAARLRSRHGVEVDYRPAGDDGVLHDFDAATKLLTVAAELRPSRQAFRMATQLGLLEQSEQIEAVLDEERFEPGHIRTLARIGLANYFAGALVLPYQRYLDAAEKLNYDVELLAERFDVGYEMAAHRLSTLQRSGARGVPFIFVRIDRAGNISKRQSATGYHFSRSGGTCPLWNVYEAFALPGQVVTQVAAMPDGQRYLWVTRTVTRRRGGFGAPDKTFAIGLGCEIRHARRLVYARGLPLDDPDAATPIGPGCPTCERPRCPQRAAPPLGRTLALNEARSTFDPYLVQDQ